MAKKKTPDFEFETVEEITHSAKMFDSSARQDAICATYEPNENRALKIEFIGASFMRLDKAKVATMIAMLKWFHSLMRD